jgi:glucose-1-phosphatase
MPEIKNIIFDLGGVLIDVDYKKTINSFIELGIKNFEEMYSQVNANQLFESLETGKISESDFFEAIKKESITPLSNTQIETAWNAMLLDFHAESLSFLENISAKYKIFLLSNTNSIHQRCFNQVFTRDTGKHCLDNYFIKAYYSHLIHMRKPHLEIYNYVLKDAGIMAADTLFIDDSINNIEGAKKLGIQTHWLLPHERIETLDFI